MASTRRKRFGRGLFVAGGAIGLVLSLASMALANVPLTKVSTDPYTNPESYHQTEEEPDTYSFGSTIVASFQVGRFSNGGANNIGWATSTDNGVTWTHGFLPGTTIYASPPGPWARISDTAVAYDPQDDVWMIEGLAIDASATGKAVIVNRSLDGGLTWQNPVTVSQGGSSSFYDKSWITCDTSASSSSFGNCYVEWDDAGLGQIFHMSLSTNGGTTWTASSVPSQSVLGGQPVVQPNGTVIVPIEGSGLDSFVSTNGGSSYTGPFDISSIQFHGVAGGLRDGAGLASAEIDGAGKVYVGWADCRFRTSCSANDIVFSTSTDGMTWTAVQRIPIVPTSSSADIFIPGFGVDHATSGGSAHLGVTAYFYPNASCSTSTCKLNALFISSTNGGATWGSPVKVLGSIKLTGLPNTTLGYMVGDYISTSFGSNGKAYPVIAGATGSNCVTGNPTACNEFMVAPTNGLAVVGGSIRSTTGPVLSRGASLSALGRTAY
jgi:hypothetical protein